MDSLKKSFFRTKHNVMAKIGKAETTAVDDYKMEKAKFEDRIRAMKELEKSVIRYMKSISDLGVVHTDLSNKLHNLFNGGSALMHSSDANLRTTTEADSAKMSFEEYCRDKVLAPIQDYITVCKILERRMSGLTVRRTDMDRYHDDLRAMEEKAAKSGTESAKLPQMREKTENATSNYTALKEELMRDFAKLETTFFTFYDPLFASVIDAQFVYYQKSLAAFSTVQRDMLNVDRTAHLHYCVNAVTPEDASVYRRADVLYSANPNANAPMGYDPNAAVNPMGYNAGGYDPQASAAATIPPNAYTATPIYDQRASVAAATIPPNNGSNVGSHIPVDQYSGSSSASVPASNQSAPPGDQLAQPIVCKAVYEFNATEPGELAFNVGDVLLIHKKFGDWWEAELNGCRGIIPSNYVQQL
eukprot:TRINITY_DN5463_c0_g1_i1.p1 TRINITY_DN5463_c0_g1~~TRINITY_DN5463_c0_g1_i1.p1  ORF type:complete len:427 (-),score=128.29 TRINITY_DN5463_c0_g1_i1:73-1317(-)